MAGWLERHACNSSAPGKAGGKGAGASTAALAFWGTLAAALAAGPWWARMLVAFAYCSQLVPGQTGAMLQAASGAGARPCAGPACRHLGAAAPGARRGGRLVALTAAGCPRAQGWPAAPPRRCTWRARCLWPPWWGLWRCGPLSGPWRLWA